MNFRELPEFRKEFRRLAKKYKSLADDLEEFRKVVSVAPLGNGSKHFKILYAGDVSIVKARLSCRYLKGSSLRIIYAYVEVDEEVEFIELYFKGDKEIEDGERVKRYLKGVGVE